jgi:hypothetical protein
MPWQENILSQPTEPIPATCWVIWIIPSRPWFRLTTWSGYQSGPACAGLASRITSVMQQLRGNEQATVVDLSGFPIL